MKHLLKLTDLSAKEIKDLLDMGDFLKAEKKMGKSHTVLSGKTLGMVFQKSSTRTRVSFESGMYQLGGMALFLSSSDLQIGRGEPIRDTARILSRYVDGIMIRTFAQEDVEELAAYSSIPVINGLTDYEHPCQALADLMTMREYLGPLEGKKIAYVGDGNNMANSLIAGCLKMGMVMACACPEGYDPSPTHLAFATTQEGRFSLTRSPKEAVSQADVVYTDVWTSMGQEKEQKQRLEAFKGYQVDSKLLALAKQKAIVQHCLPAHRGEEISEEVLESHSGEIFDQAENRLHVQKAILAALLHS